MQRHRGRNTLGGLMAAVGRAVGTVGDGGGGAWSQIKLGHCKDFWILLPVVGSYWEVFEQGKDKIRFTF